jgi:hypothetical protein
MNVMKIAGRNSLILITLLWTAGVGRATPVTPGGTVFNDLFFASQDITLLASFSSSWSNGSGSSAASGTYTDAVFINAGGTLDFAYQFTNKSTSAVSFTNTTASNFDGFATDVGYVSNGASLPGGLFMNGSTATPGIPDDISRSSDGSTITFDFNVFGTGDNIGPGVTTAVLLISTNATAYTSGGGELLASGASPLTAFEPMIPTGAPEPSYMLPLGLSLVVGVFVARRRSRSLSLG